MADTLPQGARFTATGRFLIGSLKRSEPELIATGSFGRYKSK
jgi:hypothetical protein